MLRGNFRPMCLNCLSLAMLHLLMCCADIKIFVRSTICDYRVLMIEMRL